MTSKACGLRSSQSIQELLTFEEVFDQTGHGFFNYWATISTGIVHLHYAIEILSYGYIINPMECDVKLTVVEKGLVMSAVNIGVLLMACCWGIISDRFGRKWIIIPTVLGAIVCSFLSSISSGFWALFIFRFFVGIMLAASFSTILVYLGELTCRQYRDACVSWSVTTTIVCYVAMPSLAWIMMPMQWSFVVAGLKVRPWRVYMWIWGAIGLFGLATLVILPESPRYLYAHKGARVALPVLAKIYAWNHRKKASEFPVQSMAPSAASTLDFKQRGFMDTMRLITELLRPPMRKCVLISHYGMFFVTVGTMGLAVWLPDVIHEVMNSPSSPLSVCDLIVAKYGKEDNITSHSSQTEDECKKINTSMYPIMLGAEVFFILPFVLLSVMLKYLTKIRIYSCTMWFAGITFALSAVTRQAMTAGVFFICGLSTSGLVILTALGEEIFPTELRALALSTMFMMGNLGAVVGNNVLSFCSIGLPHCWVSFILIGLLMGASALWLEFSWPKEEDVRPIMEDRGHAY